VLVLERRAFCGRRGWPLRSKGALERNDVANL
jgi:hypothetical protein